MHVSGVALKTGLGVFLPQAQRDLAAMGTATGAANHGVAAKTVGTRTVVTMTTEIVAEETLQLVVRISELHAGRVAGRMALSVGMSARTEHSDLDVDILALAERNISIVHARLVDTIADKLKHLLFAFG